MKKQAVEEAIRRIRRMEQHFDMLRAVSAKPLSVIRKTPELCQTLTALTAYYESGEWLRDYELDEMGLLPPDLKRGVLSQDALYDFLNNLTSEE